MQKCWKGGKERCYGGIDTGEEWKRRMDKEIVVLYILPDISIRVQSGMEKGAEVVYTSAEIIKKIISKMNS